MGKIKVLNIVTSNIGYNGICTSLLNYYRNIDSHIVRMDFLAPNKVDKKLRNDFESAGGNKLLEATVNEQKMYKVKPISYYFMLKKLIKNEKYDIVQVHGSSSMMLVHLLAAKRAGVKVRIAHCRNTKSDHKLLHKILLPAFRKTYNVAFACGREAGEWLFGKNADFMVVPNGKDVDVFKYNDVVRKEYREKYNLDDKIVIGHIGNFNYQKNHDYLINIFNELASRNDKYRLVLVGKGDLQNEIKQKVKKLGLDDKVLFLGQVPVDEVAKLLNMMDIMVFPSRFEGFPNVLIEWQMNGLPCVISDAITKDVRITDLVRFMSLEKDAKDWADEIENVCIMDRNVSQDVILEQIRETGYDIKSNAKMLEKRYGELVRREDLK